MSTISPLLRQCRMATVFNNNGWKQNTSRTLQNLPYSTTATSPTPSKSKSTTTRALQTHREMSSIQRRTFSKEMKDEYGEMTADGESFIKKDYVLEDGTILPEAELRYQTYGTLNERRDNVIVVCHALTGNASLHSWWGGLLGSNLAFDTDKYLVVCCNILGSCYGSTNPQSVNPATGNVYGRDFPNISVQDTVKLQLQLLKEELGVSSIKAAIGGSFGGMQTMEFAVQAGSSDAEFLSDDGKL